MVLVDVARGVPTWSTMTELLTHWLLGDAVLILSYLSRIDTLRISCEIATFPPMISGTSLSTVQKKAVKLNHSLNWVKVLPPKR